ncbi:MAG: hypothetical protein GEU75_02985 [Dehalococcoidia bacterium]|nr:hypothetical protein [Dehalococcoidia bacterium]
MHITHPTAPGLVDPAFKAKAGRYVAQTGLATMSLLILLLLGDALSNAAIVTAIAASAFLIFIGPNARLAQPKRVIGGHLLGCCIGLVFALLLHLVPDSISQSFLATNSLAALAVGIGILAMGATDTEHPPAAGTILGLVLGDRELEIALLLLLSIGLLHATRTLLRRWLVDLL